MDFQPPPNFNVQLKTASCGGHGTLEIRDVTQFLEQNQIPCCVVGVSALIFYGVPRVRDKWEICVPEEKLEEAFNLLQQQKEYFRMTEERIPQCMSLEHTWTSWFRGSDTDYEFCIVPSTHKHLQIGCSPVYRSPNGVPYAPLKELVQSFVDIYDLVSLDDIVDGANLTYEWGETHLDLHGTTDVEWAHQRNAELWKWDPSQLCSSFPTLQVNKAEVWRKTTKNKEERLMHMMLPHELFVTRYMLKGKHSEPWKEHHDAS